MESSLLTELAELIEQGGFVMWWLVPSTFVLWWAVGDRVLSTTRGDSRPLDEIIVAFLAGEQHTRGVLGQAVSRALELPSEQRTPGMMQERFADLYAQISRHRTLIASIATTAPLVGLLGTVSGMISTFDALTTSTLVAREAGGGVAGGISVALVSTQMGLVVAIPGMLAGQLLERRQAALEDELDTIGDLVRERTGEGAWR